MVQLSSDLRKQYLYRTTDVLCAQCLDLSNLDNPRGTESHIIGHAFSEPARLIRGQGVGRGVHAKSTDSVPANCAMRNRPDRNEVVVAGMPAGRVGKYLNNCWGIFPGRPRIFMMFLKIQESTN